MYNEKPDKFFNFKLEKRCISKLLNQLELSQIENGLVMSELQDKKNLKLLDQK